MTDSDDPTNDATTDDLSNGHEIARLLRAAGPRPHVPAKRADRVRSTVHLHWRYVNRRGRRLRWLTRVAAPLAAAAAGSVFIGPNLSRWIPSSRPVAASIATTEVRDGSVHAASAGLRIDVGDDGRVSRRQAERCLVEMESRLGRGPGNRAFDPQGTSLDAVPQSAGRENGS